MIIPLKRWLSIKLQTFSWFRYTIQQNDRLCSSQQTLAKITDHTNLDLPAHYQMTLLSRNSDI